MGRVLLCVAVAVALVGCSHVPKPAPPAATMPASEASSVRGRYQVGDRPAADIQLGLFARRWIDDKHRIVASASTDSEGQFEFAHISPGEYAIYRTGRGPFGEIVAEGAALTWVDVSLGTSSVVTIGGNGGPVVGRVIVPKKLAAAMKSLRAELLRDAIEPDWPVPADVQHASMKLYAEWKSNFLASEAGRRWEQAELAAHQGPEEYDAVISSDNVFRFEDVPPGKYTIQIQGTADGENWVYLVSALVEVPTPPSGRGAAAFHIPAIVVKQESDAPLPTTTPAPFTVHVADRQGKPLAGVEVIVRGEGGNIGGVTDAQGQCAIDQGVQRFALISVGLDGYHRDEKTAPAGATEIDFHLDRLPRVHGKVADAATGRPIARFDCMIVSYFDSDTPTRSEPTLFADGAYQMLLDEPVEAHRSWRVRVEADGYLPRESPMVSKDAELDLALTPAPDLAGRVMGPDGKPVMGVTVWAATPRRNVVLQSYRDARPSAYVAITDAPGRFDLWPEGERFVIAAAGDQGYAVATDFGLAGHSDIHLTAWSSIQGQVQFAGKPGIGQIVNIYPAGWPFAHLGDFVQSSVYQDQSAVTDMHGAYHFDHVPMGLISVAWSTNSLEFPYRTFGDQQETDTVRMVGGQRVTVNFSDFGRASRPVTGRIQIAPGAAGWEPGEKTNMVRTPLSSIRHDVPGWSCLHEVQLDSKGEFRFDALPAGKYELAIEPEFSERSGHDQGTLEFTIPEIPDVLRGKPIVLPIVELKRAAPIPPTQPPDTRPRGLH